MNADDDKKNVRVKLAQMDVTDVDQSKIIKKIGPFVDIYSKIFENVKVEISSAIKDSGERNFVIIMGERKEEEDERSNRLGIAPDKSWISEYASLVDVTKKDAESEMKKMISEELTLSPRDWLEHKKKKLENFFNVKK